MKRKENDNWLTPLSVYEPLNEEFNFDFDPCPYNEGEIVNDGLKIDWGLVNFVNPPYSPDLKKAFILKAIEEKKKGKTSVLLIPVKTSTKLFHDFIKPNASDIRFVRGRISMIVVFKP